MDLAHDMANNRFRWLAMALGCIALLIAIVQFGAGPFAPQKTVERSIAELAVNISREVVQVVKNKPATLEARTWSIDDMLTITGGVLAAGAIVFDAIGFVVRENRRPALVGVGLGVGVITFQLVTWVALLVAGLVLLWIVIANLGSILGSAGFDG